MKEYKIYSIGRGLDNDIVYDEHSNPKNMYISGHHAVLKVTLLGKYYINDFSTNGTMVNGQRIGGNRDVEVRRGDTIVFGGVEELDWSLIARPRTPIYIGAIVVLALIVVLLMVNRCHNGHSSSSTPVVDGVPAASGNAGKSKVDSTRKDSMYKYKDDKQKAAKEEIGNEVNADDNESGGGSFIDKYLHQKTKKQPAKPAQSQRKTTHPTGQPATGKQKTVQESSDAEKEKKSLSGDADKGKVTPNNSDEKAQKAERNKNL